MQSNEDGSDVSTGRSELRVPIGGPLESVELYMPMASTTVPEVHDVSPDLSMTSRARRALDDAWSSVIGELEPVVIAKANAMRDSLRQGSEKVHDAVVDQVAHVRVEANKRMARAESDMRAHPTKWAGVAAGVGLGIGLLGRVLRRRRTAQQVPRLVIIEAC